MTTRPSDQTIADVAMIARHPRKHGGRIATAMAAQGEGMTVAELIARVQAGTTAPQPDPERDEAARRGASPGTKC